MILLKKKKNNNPHTEGDVFELYQVKKKGHNPILIKATYR